MAAVSRPDEALSRDGRAARRGTFIFSPDPAHTEIAARAGFDLVIVDLEHAPLALADVVAHARAARAGGISCWARVGQLDPLAVGRLLDTGVDGVVLPHFGVDPAASRACLAAFQYPPRGTRPACSGVRSAGYGLSDFAAEAERGSMAEAVALIEDAAVLDRLDEVLAWPGLHAVIPGGPGDLAASLGLPGQGDHATVRAAVERIVTAAKAQPGLKAGLYVTGLPSLASWRGGPLDFVVLSIDYRVLAHAYRAAAEALTASGFEDPG